MKIKYKVLLVAILVLMLPFFVISIFVKESFEKYHLYNKNLHAQKVVVVAEKEIEDCFTDIIDSAKSFASLECIKQYLDGSDEFKSQAEYTVEGLVQSGKGIIQVAVYDTNGNLSPISSSYDDFIYPSISAKSIDGEIVEKSGFTEINKYMLSNKTKNTFCYVFKIYNGDVLVGYGMFYYNLDMFEDIVYNVNESTEYTMAIVDNSGNVIKAPFNEVSKYTDYKEFDAIQGEFETVMKGKSFDSKNYTFSNKNYVALGCGINDTKDDKGFTWGIVATIPKETMMESVNALSMQTISFVFVFTGVIIVFASFIILKYLKPLDKIYTIFEKRAAGDKTVRFEYDGHGDIVRIGNSINVLLDMINERDECYDNLVNMTDNIIFEYNIPKNIITFSDNFNSKFSYRANSLKFEDSFFANGIVQRSQKADFENFVDRFLSGEACQGEFSFKTIYNDYAWYIVRCAPIKDSDENIVKIVGAMIDINRAKLREENLLKKASYDSLTQIFNRHTFEVSLMNEYDLSQMRKTKIAVLFIDIDDFKYYNNNFCHALGDEALAFVGRTLKRIVGNNGFAGRYGGDEFVICYSETPSIMSAGELASEVIEELGKGFDGEAVKEHFDVKCSIGIAYFTEQSVDADSVIKDADMAMYTVKKNGKSDFSYYSKPRR